MRQSLATTCLALATALLLSACAQTIPVAPAPQHNSYFDPHNHLSGVLPWPAYADLPAYMQQIEGQGNGVTRADKLAFYTWLADSWYPDHLADTGTQPFSASLRFGLGARATLAVFPPSPDMSTAVLDGALARLYTATPFTEFDSAYAFHDPAWQWLTQTYYDGNMKATAQAICNASILELARTGITRSEQSISFIGGWRFGPQGQSPKLATIMCAANGPQRLQATLAAAGLPQPRLRIILMTHTSELGSLPGGKAYSTFLPDGTCHAEPLNPALKLDPQRLYNALLGKDKDGTDIVADDQEQAFFTTLVGIDTAAPESTCFTTTGMTYYRQLVDAVYRAAKQRRAAGWDGKLLVHTHVGEGFTVYYGKQQPEKPWTFAKVFAQVPELDDNIVTNAPVTQDNIGKLLDAVAAIRAEHPDLDKYVVIRFGHVTHATLAQAKRMARLHIEADINLDSNIATGAWDVAHMPGHKQLAAKMAAAAATPQGNWQLNNLPAFLIPDPDNAQQVAAVFGTHPLKYMLMAGVRVMLGSDGAGVEHSSMRREYAMAASLIDYWHRHNPAFRRAAGNISTQLFFDNAQWHLANMAGNRVLAYRP